MLRKVLKDYRDGFSWSRFKETYHFSMLWMYIYLLTIFPIILDLNEKTEYMVRYYLVAVPLLFGIYGLSAIPLRLPKQMFLCPLSEVEREKYVKMMFTVRLMVPVLVGGIFFIATAVVGLVPAELLVLEFFGMASMMLCGSLTTWPGSTWERTDADKKRLKVPEYKGLYGISCTGMIAGICISMVITVGWDGKPDMLFEILIGILAVAALVCDILVLRYFEPVMKNCIDYETSYGVKTQEAKA